MAGHTRIYDLCGRAQRGRRSGHGLPGLVYKGQRVVVPRGAREEILNRLHSSHIGVNGCLRRAKECVFYRRYQEDSVCVRDM